MNKKTKKILRNMSCVKKNKIDVFFDLVKKKGIVRTSCNGIVMKEEIYREMLAKIEISRHRLSELTSINNGVDDE